MKRRFEFHGGKAPKFWEVEALAAGYELSYGKIGRPGQTKFIACTGSERIRRGIAKRVETKLREGYTEVEAEQQDREDHRAKLERAPELEAALFDDPDDLATWQVYADWLGTKGDAHGELIIAELLRGSAESPGRRDALTRRIEALTDRHRATWLGDLGHLEFGDVQLDLGWRYGYVHRASVRRPTHPTSGVLTPTQLLLALLRAPASLFLHTLRLEPAGGSLVELGACLTDVSPLDSLRALELGDGGDFWDISHVEVGPLDPLLAHAPGLRALEVRGNYIMLEDLAHSTLASLVLETSNLSRTTAAALAEARLPACEQLTIFIGSSEYGVTATLDDLRPLLREDAGQRFPALTHLGLCNAEFQDELAGAVARSAILPRLRRLDLSCGTLHGEGIEAIIRHADAFAHLEHIDLSDNYIGLEDRGRLRAALPNVTLDLSRQREAFAEGDYYVSVAE